MEKWVMGIFSPCLPLWWCFAVLHVSGTQRGIFFFFFYLMSVLTVWREDMRRRNMLLVNDGWPGFLSVFGGVIFYNLACLMSRPCGSHDCSTGRLWAVSASQPHDGWQRWEQLSAPTVLFDLIYGLWHPQPFNSPVSGYKSTANIFTLT